MDKNLIGLIATWGIIIIGLVVIAFIKKENKLLSTGILFVIIGGCSYLSIFFFDIPVYAKYSTFEGNNGKTELLWVTGIGVVLMLYSKILNKTNKK